MLSVKRSMHRLQQASGLRKVISSIWMNPSRSWASSDYVIPKARTDLKKIPRPDPFKNKDPCWQALRRTEYKCRTDPEFLIDAFIYERKKCLSDPCAWDVPRADLRHYRVTDKLRRRYQRTWNRCVIKKRKMKMQFYCQPVKYKRRKFKKFVKRAQSKACMTSSASNTLGLAKCLKKVKPKVPCPHITAPFCKPGVVPPRCIKGHRSPKKCRRRLTKYPAFSECLIDPLPESPPTECNCLKTPMMCQVWEYYRSRKS